MSGIIDCAVLLHAAEEEWLSAWLHRSAGAGPRLRLHACPLAREGSGQAEVQALSGARLSLRRYDVAILPVSYASLSWTRTALADMRRSPALPVPLLALVSGLKAPAIQDLFELGVADFLREDACVDDLRVRMAQLTSGTAMAALDGAGRGPSAGPQDGEAGGGTPSAPPPLLAPVPALPILRDASHGESPWDPRRDTDETFRTAKTRVVATFERDYITRALARHAGNISMAARSAHKHRRAFWALMRKHRIDAGPYRSSSCCGDD